MKKICILIVVVLLFSNCRISEKPSAALHNEDISKVISFMTDIMVHDVTNPPLAARFFSYACLAGYEVTVQHEKDAISMKNVLNEYPEIKKPEGLGFYSYQVAAVLAMMETAKKMQPSGGLFTAYQQAFIDSCLKLGFSEETVRQSGLYALHVSKQILAYAKSDGYNKISNYPRYTPATGEGNWYPTPPGFFAPVEPYFHTVRPFTLDSCAQFQPVPPVPFSSDKNSQFYKMVVENYQAGGSGLTGEHRQIAAFWDCNPFALQDNGHMLLGVKKISPGAHWLGIAGIACHNMKTDFSKAMEINTLVAISLMDGFISCWDEKFRSNRIRPETAIRKLIDPHWKPLLQTPPFPEYLSGHSTISTAAAVILTHYFGDEFHYTDNIEERFGLASRKFSSFKEAAAEAAVSRFYGGIHFKDAIENGITQGRQVGEWIINKFEKGNDRKSRKAVLSTLNETGLQKTRGKIISYRPAEMDR